MNNILTLISDMDVSNGETRRLNCPNCNGYKTFSVTNNMGKLLWNCYKASCSLSGSTRTRMSVDDIRSGFIDRDETGIVDFTLPEYVVKHRDNPDLQAFCDKWQLDADELGLLYDVKENRVVFPVIHDNEIVDATGRSLGKKLPKWKRYGKNDLPYAFGSGNVAVVVEDCVSAAAVSSFGNFVGVAVLGTSLSPSHKEFLTQFSTAIIALDPDALKKTLAFAKELRGHVRDVRVLKLTDDLKYRNQQDIEALTDIGV